MKKVLIVGGGDWQVPIIKKCKELGLFTICSNLYENSPGFCFSDSSYVCDVLDISTNLNIAKDNSVDAVITDQSDIAVNTVAYVAEKLSLMGIGINNANLFTNKFRMRSEIKTPGLRHPKWDLCKNYKQALSFLDNSTFKKIILKPTCNQSSRGVLIVKNEDDLKKSLPLTLKFCIDDEFLVEEFIEGEEFTVEGFKSYNRKHKTLAISRKKHYAGTSIANALIYDGYNADIRNKLIKINDLIFNSLNFGITHVEYKVSNGEVFLIEAAARGGGTKVSSHVIPAVSGVDVNELLIKTAVFRETPEFDSFKPRCAVLKFFSAKSGVINEITNLDLMADDRILDWSLPLKVGESISEPSDDRSRIGYYIASTETTEELYNLIHKIDHEVKINVR